MNAITAEPAGLEGGGVALGSAGLDGLSARVEEPLLREDDDGWDDSVVVWNGTVAWIPPLHQPTLAREGRQLT